MNKSETEALLRRKGFDVDYTTQLIIIAVKGGEKITIRFTNAGDCVSVICERTDTSDSLKLNAKEKYGAVINISLRGNDLVFSLSKTSYRAEIIL